MHNLTWQGSTFLKDGQPYNVVSGEFHYFRVPRADWRKRLRIFREGGGNTIATYVPWVVHEPVEGTFCFGGHDYDELDEFLTICKEEGIAVVARPGPYQYSELLYGGLPKWLCLDYPETSAQSLEGRPLGASSKSYLHPLFLEKTHRWFQAVCPILAKHTANNGGAIVAAQVDNETMGMHSWRNKGWADYHPVTYGIGSEEGRWPDFLKKKYGTIEKVSEAWGVELKSFAEALPICREPRTYGEARRLRDYDLCYYTSIGEYFQILTQWLREGGVDVPIVHNSPNPESNAGFYEACDMMGEGFLLGSDHYYTLDQTWPQNNPTPQYAVRNFISLELLRNLNVPPTVFEMPSGSLSDWPPVTAYDAKTAYLLNAAFGMQGWNYYIWTGGPNVPDTGSTADVYDYGAPVSATGEVRDLYYAQKEFHETWAAHKLAGSTMETDFVVGYDRQMLRSWHYTDIFSGESAADLPHVDTGAEGPQAAWEMTRIGVVTTALCAGLSPELLDIETYMPDPKKPLVVCTSRMMPRAAQEHLVAFLNAGGKLMYGPFLPEVDEDLQPCTLLLEALGYTERPFDAARTGRAIMDMDAVSNIMINLGAYAMDLPEGHRVLAHDRNTGNAMAHIGPAGHGEALWLGLRWQQAKREHEVMLRALMAELGVTEPVITHSNPNPFTVLRRKVDGSLCAIVMNLYSCPMTTAVEINIDGRIIPLQTMTLAPMEVRLFDL